jgi:hypothetical protein
MDRDTPRRDRYLELLRARTPVERLVQAAELTMAVRRLAEIGIRERHPQAGDAEVRARLVVRLYGRDVARRLHQEVPDDAV